MASPIKRVVWSISWRRYHCISTNLGWISPGKISQRFDGQDCKIFKLQIIDSQIDSHHCGQISFLANQVFQGLFEVTPRSRLASKVRRTRRRGNSMLQKKANTSERLWTCQNPRHTKNFD